MEGTIMVDGVLASCYASVDHDLGHFAMTCIRWFPEIIGWIFGQGNGYQGYANTFEEFGTWMAPTGQMY